MKSCAGISPHRAPVRKIDIAPRWRHANESRRIYFCWFTCPTPPSESSYIQTLTILVETRILGYARFTITAHPISGATGNGSVSIVTLG